MSRSARPSSLLLPPGAGRDADSLVAAVIAEIAAGRVALGDALPSTRVLAADLGVPRAVVVTAYDALAVAGIVAVQAGSGTTVAVDRDVAAGTAGLAATVPARDPLPVKEIRRRVLPDRVVHNLMPGAPDVRLIRERDWRQSWRVAATTVPDLDWYRPMNHPELEVALVDHLRRTRGIATRSEDVVIFPGVTAAVHAVVHALDAQRAAMEDPGYPMARIPLQRNVPRVDLIPVDDDGIDVGRLGHHDLVYVTPAHQFPLGGRLPADRRDALLRWALREEAVVIEDDFDGEYRHDSAPLGPLRASVVGADRVVYVGTASKILTPHLRLAWAVVPSWMSEAVRAAGASLRLDADRIASIALAHHISSGHLARHLGRAQRTYSARRRRLVSALAMHLPDWELVGIEAGIHVAARWAEVKVRDTDVARACAARGVAVAPLSEYAAEHSSNGLLLGYAQLPETQADRAVREIADALAEVRGRAAPDITP